ncbi:MAG TPA: carboxylating nicotinate-nucleotide diphosphorylase, partial [Gammaproteobacteria bacterium]|nr:carboxylating nicotinate-nucleotide diphosphorylase [Gammaproteobacteria bacterium]
MSPSPSLSEVREDVRRALHEDTGPRDLSAAAVPGGVQAEAELVVRGEAVLCGRDWFEQAFLLLDERVRFDWQVAEGEKGPRNQVLCVVDGPARPMLTAERTALNFLQLLSGVATRTRAYVDAVEGTGVDILDTRKTLPGLRRAQKYAVACGGGVNHRMGLYDGILLKENHILACGNIIDAVEEARTQGSDDVEIEVEVEDNHQLREA